MRVQHLAGPEQEVQAGAGVQVAAGLVPRLVAAAAVGPGGAGALRGGALPRRRRLPAAPRALAVALAAGLAVLVQVEPAEVERRQRALERGGGRGGGGRRATPRLLCHLWRAARHCARAALAGGCLGRRQEGGAGCGGAVPAGGGRVGGDGTVRVIILRTVAAIRRVPPPSGPTRHPGGCQTRSGSHAYALAEFHVRHVVPALDGALHRPSGV